MSKPQCMTCRFYDNEAICRRYPPRFADGSQDKAGIGQWPLVHGYEDWCGEHRPTEQEASQERREGVQDDA